MKSFFAAVAFLTRFPVGTIANISADDVARSAGWFPLIGILLGAIYSLAAGALKDHLPFGVVAVLLVALDAIATGVLHFDGLADSADGFGGGKTRDDILRIMRDHSIGSYGGVTLIILIALKATACAALLARTNWMPAFILTPALGRWSMLLLTATLPYARLSASVIDGMGKRSLLWGTGVILAALLAAKSTQAWIAVAAVVAVTFIWGFYCRRRIAGITGDTLGANLQFCEGVALLTFLWSGHAQ